MSCPSEETLSFYADGELSIDALREVESHLVGCQHCRGSVLALRDEIGLLGDVLHDRDLGRGRVHAPQERARGLVFGVGPALGVAALVVTTLGWVLERNLPAGTSLLSPIRLMGAYEMTLETVFMLRDEVPGLMETALTQGALFAVAAIGTFLVSTLDKRIARTGAVILALTGLALAAPDAEAFDLRHDVERVVVPADETWAQTLVVSADEVRIEGTLDGDLFAFTKRLRITGTVNGSVFVVANDVDLLGRIAGSLYVGGEVVRIEGPVDGQLYGFCEDVTVSDSSRVGRDAAMVADLFQVDGKIDRDVAFGGERIEVRGHVGRNLLVRGQEAALLDEARIGGDFDAQLEPGNEVEVADGARIGGERIEGELDWNRKEQRSRWASRHFYVANLVVLVSAFIVGMLLHLVRPSLFELGVPTTADFFRELGFGFVAIVCVPVAIVVCFATVVGIPIGIIMIFTYLTALFVSMVIVASLIGQGLLRPPPGSNSRFGIALLLGLLLLVLAVNLPLIGGLLRFVALMTGMGILVTHAVDSWRTRVV